MIPDYHYPEAYLYRRLLQAKLFMDAHFHESINLDSIADEACFSRFHFIRIFKKIYRLTPHQYLVKVRIENAKKLLQSSIPVASACYACGFESVGSFTSLFKKMTGQTPAECRTLQLAVMADKKSVPLKYVPACFAAKYGWLEISNF